MARKVLHTTIHHQCAACSQLFRPGETLVALVYRNSSLDIYKNLLFTSISQDREQQRKRDLHSMFCRRSDCALCSSMRQPELVLPDAENDSSLLDAPPEVENVFCKKAHCRQCQIVEESISVHTDCFELFEKHCAIGDGENSPEQKNEKYRRLWLAGTRRYAWRKMQPLKFPSSTTLAFPQPEIISKLCGFQKIFLPEVVRLIQSYSKLHIIWRYCSAIQLAQELGSAKAEAAVIYDVPKILSWSRGSPPKVVQDKSLAGSFIRFTIDHRASTAGEIRASSCVFAVEPIEKLSDDKLKFELGLCRLQVPRKRQITIWSDPDPIHLMRFLPSEGLDQHNRFAAIRLDPEYCTGISLFINSHLVHEIHAHSKRHSTHLERFEYLRSMIGHEIVWIYIPLTAQDQITAIDIRKYVTEKERPHHFTRNGPGTFSWEPAVGTLYEAGDTRRPLALIHHVPSSGSMEFIGTDADKQTETAEPNVQRQDWPLHRAFFSFASLEGVLDVHVFSDELRNLCKGILFEYENGSKRTVGQCRLGWDRVQSWRKPLSMFYDSASYQITDPAGVRDPVRHKSARVTFDSESDHVSEDGTLDKSFYPMRGCLNFWFLINDVEIEIVGS
ncbi:hypothetical protein CI102_14443 [Trichoderma harzianum]|nr:hypothetical protein CI102_14443 [Trichoderma harzianum]